MPESFSAHLGRAPDVDGCDLLVVLCTAAAQERALCRVHGQDRLLLVQRVLCQQQYGKEGGFQC